MEANTSSSISEDLFDVHGCLDTLYWQLCVAAGKVGTTEHTVEAVMLYRVATDLRAARDELLEAIDRLAQLELKI